jgi:hypothetical protein
MRCSRQHGKPRAESSRNLYVLDHTTRAIAPPPASEMRLFSLLLKSSSRNRIAFLWSILRVRYIKFEATQRGNDPRVEVTFFERAGKLNEGSDKDG